MRRIIPALLLYLVIFAIFFFLSLYNYYLNRPFFDIGIPTETTNILMILLSAGGIIKTAYHIIKV